MSKSNIKSLSRLALIKMVAGRFKAVSAGSTEPVRDLYDYTPNRLARELHPHVQHLVVKEIVEHGPDCKSILLGPDEEAGTKALAWFEAGQYLVVNLEIEGKRYSRPYSIASSPRDTLDGVYRLTIKRVQDGIVSNYVLDHLAVGQKVVTSAPLGQSPFSAAATTAAQAPVPQARVSPLPRSQTRIRRVVGVTTRTNSVLIRAGKRGACSNFGPMSSRSKPSMPSQKTTQWGLPTLTQVTAYSFPPTVMGQSTIFSAVTAAGIFSGRSSALPMSTDTLLTLPSRRKRRMG